MSVGSRWVGCTYLNGLGGRSRTSDLGEARRPLRVALHAMGRRRRCQRRRAIQDQISSTTPKGHAPCRKP